jgi:hypothetical protein
MWLQLQNFQWEFLCKNDKDNVGVKLEFLARQKKNTTNLRQKIILHLTETNYLIFLGKGVGFSHGL